MNIPISDDECRHEAGSGRFWSESWYLDWFDAQGCMGGYVHLSIWPNLGHAWFWCGLVQKEERPVLIVDQEIPIPKAPGLEIRSTGLWADLITEVPFEYFSVEVEAFGVALDSPSDSYRGMRGERLPVGLDLGWEIDSPLLASETTEPWVFRYEFINNYEIPCRVAGEIQVGDRRIKVDGWGQRGHSWAERDWWSSAWTWVSGRLEDGERFHLLVTEGSEVGIGYRSTPRGLLEEFEFSSSVEFGDMQIPVGGCITLGSQSFELDPIEWAPVVIIDPDTDFVSRLPRGLVAVSSSDGRCGYAWVEYNQPQGLPSSL